MFGQESFASHHKPRSAITALLGVIINEGLLNGMELSIGRQSLNRDDLFGLRINSQDGAGVNDFTPHHHCTGPTCGSITDPLGASKF